MVSPKKFQSMGQFVWILVDIFALFSLSSACENAIYPSNFVYTYTRFDEIENCCGSYLASTLELNLDEDRGDMLENELSFSNGDWEQERGGAPLMPFDESDMPKNQFSLINRAKLVSFELKDVNPVRQWKNAVTVGGYMTIGIFRNRVHDSKFGFKLGFTERPGLSALVVMFEGVYMEIEENGGQRVMCLVGNSSLPSWSGVVDDPLLVPSDFGSISDGRPRVSGDDQILLILRYPQTFSLTSRAIKGELTSLSPRDSVRYFDQVYITSQLRHFSRYHFSGEVQSRLSDVDPYEDEIIEDGAIEFSGAEFCKFIGDSFTLIKHFNVRPHHKYNLEDSHIERRSLGPFTFGKAMEDISWSYNNFRLIFQHVYCENATQERANVTKVLASIRAIPQLLSKDLAISMTGLSGMTLSAEGLWNSSTGQLHMVGCVGVVDSGIDECSSRVSVYFSKRFSATRRSIVRGSISTLGSRMFIPLSFGVIERPAELGFHSPFSDCCRYDYTKVDQARAFWNRNQPVDTISMIKQSLLRYPALQNTEDIAHQLSTLSDRLRFHTFAVPNPHYDSSWLVLFLEGDILSLGPLCACRHLSSTASKYVSESRAEVLHGRLLNVSLHLTFAKPPLLFMETSYNNVSRLFLEGLYDTRLGEMYLIGCREVETGSAQTERGLDCLIEAKIQYSSETTRWLKTPIIEITITSLRNKDDPVYFSAIGLQSLMLPSNGRDLTFRVLLEGSVRILGLVVEITIILSQLLYMRKNAVVVPYVSLVMLGIQALGYCFPLFSGEQILFKSEESKSYVKHPEDYGTSRQLINVLEYFGKLLLLTASMIVLMLSKKVVESRKALGPHVTTESKHVPNDMQVLRTTVAIYLLVFLTLYVVPGMLLLPKINWRKTLIGYYNLIQTFFFLPQILADFLWQNQTKPVRLVYSVGFILSGWFVGHYDGFRYDPVSSAYSLDAGSSTPDIVWVIGRDAFSVIVIVVATTIIIQRRWNHQKNKPVLDS